MSDQLTNRRSRFIFLSSISLATLGLLSQVYFTMSFEGNPSLEDIAAAIVAQSMLLLALSSVFVICHTAGERKTTVISMVLVALCLQGNLWILNEAGTFLRNNLFSIYVIYGLVALFFSSVASQNYADTKKAKNYITNTAPTIAALLAVLTLGLQLYVNQSYAHKKQGVHLEVVQSTLPIGKNHPDERSS